MPVYRITLLAGLSDWQWVGIFGIRSAVNERAHTQQVSIGILKPYNFGCPCHQVWNHTQNIHPPRYTTHIYPQMDEEVQFFVEVGTSIL